MKKFEFRPWGWFLTLDEGSDYKVKKIYVKPKSRFSLQYQLIKDNFDSLITFNSIASIEAIVKGFPATTLGPNAGSYLSNTDIKNIDNPKYPKEGSIIEHMFYLSLCQFTSQEMASGWAFKVINQLQGDQKPNNFKLGPHTATLY